MLTFEQVSRHLAYDPDAGLLLRLTGPRRGQVAGHRSSAGYVQAWCCGKLHYAHALAWLLSYGEWPEPYIDHADGDRSNNRLANLRLATQSLNSANARRRCDNTSGFKGVFRHSQTGRWRCQITKDGHCKSLGLFDSPEAAHAAYIMAARELFGEFARAA